MIDLTNWIILVDSGEIIEGYMLRRKRASKKIICEAHLGDWVVITEPHYLYDQVRSVGDKARIYLGEIYGVVGPGEVALVFEGEDFFQGTPDLYFRVVSGE